VACCTIFQPLFPAQIDRTRKPATGGLVNNEIILRVLHTGAQPESAKRDYAPTTATWISLCILGKALVRH